MVDREDFYSTIFPHGDYILVDFHGARLHLTSSKGSLVLLNDCRTKQPHSIGVQVYTKGTHEKPGRSFLFALGPFFIPSFSLYFILLLSLLELMAVIQHDPDMVLMRKFLNENFISIHRKGKGGTWLIIPLVMEQGGFANYTLVDSIN